MPRVESFAAGTPCWVDLGSADVGASVDFYCGLFGWDATELPPEAGGYRHLELAGATVAGVGPLVTPGRPPAWMTYVSVDDVEAASSPVTAAGGTVTVPPMDVLDAGRLAVFADATGAVCALWQPWRRAGADVVNEAGALVWNELVTRDTAGSAAFYAAVLGWWAEDVDMGGTAYSEWKLDDTTVAGMLPMPAEVPPGVPNHWLTYFAVDDCDDTVTRATAAGATVLAAPTDIPPGRFSVLADPTGAQFAVLALAAG